MLKRLIIFLGVFAASQAAALHALQSPVEARDNQPPVVDATYDGSCFYPKPTAKFNLQRYLGIWYQVAGTTVYFTEGCKCTYADYTLNNNGTVNVKNACKAPGFPPYIEGTATRLPKNAGYGQKGVLKATFPGSPPPSCPGPNYIVQDIGGAFPGTSYQNGAQSFAIVQTSNFTTLFLLSREQHPSNASITAWLQRAEQLGSDLSNVVLTDQQGCKPAQAA